MSTIPTVVVAEDERTIRSLIRLTLDTGRFRIVEVEDGVSALASVKEQRPDLLFLDWGMPGRSGIEVCKELRADPALAATKIVMLTARSQEADRVAALAAGADDFITKPFSPLELLEKVAEVIGPDALL